MFSVASLLNPAKSEPRGTRLPSSPLLSFCASSSTHGSPQLSTQSSIKKQKMTKDGAIFAKGNIKGEVNYPPFENLSDEMMREVQNFQVYPLGKIREYCRHIPYNSEKKSFLEKTGRESFEVFQYTFKVPGDDKEYCVMWDYNIGLVRITPFFKCCKYSKTTPAKMLNMNPGLKDITHSITGGALAAQGYWMPYTCALEICATFCSHIAPALVPIFGPLFPSRCVPVEAPEHGRMIIDPLIVLEATAQAEPYRLRYSTYVSSPKSSSGESSSPQNTIRHDIRSAGHPRHRSDKETQSTQTLGRRLRLKRAFDDESSYETTTSTDSGGISSGEGAFFSSNSFVMPLSSMTGALVSRPRSWVNHNNAQNHNDNMLAHSNNSSVNMSAPSRFKGPNPLLSAIPRSRGVMEMQMALSRNHRGMWPAPNLYLNTSNQNGQAQIKRRIEEVEGDEDYDASGESCSATGTDDKSSMDDKTSEAGLGGKAEDVSMTGSADFGVGAGTDAGAANSASSTTCSGMGDPSSTGVAEKKAAWLLMKLSVKDAERGPGDPADTSDGTREKVEHDLDGGVRLGFRFGAVGSAVRSGADEDGPRIKRRRAASL